MAEVATISPSELSEQKSNESFDLIDVRTPVEFREVHASMAKNYPLDRLDPQHIMQGREGSDEKLYVICKSGSRGRQACEKFIAAGFTNVVNVAGGTQAWDAAGLPVKRGQKAISLERQVRILAGFIVLVGALLAIFVHQYYAGISAFIGAGLMFAGITDTCGMGMMLSKMPWKQVKETGENCSVQ